MPSSSIPPQTHPHVTKGRQVGCFSRPETDDADLVISNLFSLMNFNKYEEAVKLFTWYSADLLFRTLKNSLYLKSIPWTSLSHTVVGKGFRALVLYGGSWSETGCPKILKNSNFPLLKACVKIVSLPKILWKTADQIRVLLQQASLTFFLSN